MSSIVNKVRKLLNLARSKGATAGEVETAARLAQEMMQKHHLTDMDVSVSVEDGSNIVDVPIGADGFMATWKFALIAATARAFFCEAVGLRAGRRRKVRIVGRREDAEVVVTVFGFLLAEIEKLSATRTTELSDFDFWLHGERFSTRQRMDAYRSGLAAGVASTLNDQANKFRASSGTALMVVERSRAANMSYVDNKFGTTGRKTVSVESKRETRSDFEDGFEKGKTIEIDKSLRAPTDRTQQKD